MNTKIKAKVRIYSDDMYFEYIFTCIEVQQEQPYYGNGKYINIVKSSNGYNWKVIDARYIQDYNFMKVVRQVFEEYYGENLRHIEFFQ